MPGTASTDFDLYDMDGGLTTIFDASFDTQDGTGGDDFPIEFIGGGTFGGERLLIDKFAAGTTSSVPMFNLIVFRGELDDTVATNGATRGHSGAAAAFSVAATPAAASFDGISPDGPFPGLFTAANASEDFTSDGPRRIILSPTGVELTPGNRTSTGGTVRQKPDITAADGVSTAAPGFSPFYGTSAAAPHAAAIAALVKSAVPAITPAQMRTALISSAIDIEARQRGVPGTTNLVDRDTGAGIVMAHAAIQTPAAYPRRSFTRGTVTPTQNRRRWRRLHRAERDIQSRHSPDQRGRRRYGHQRRLDHFDSRSDHLERSFSYPTSRSARRPVTPLVHLQERERCVQRDTELHPDGDLHRRHESAVFPFTLPNGSPGSRHVQLARAGAFPIAPGPTLRA